MRLKVKALRAKSGSTVAVQTLADLPMGERGILELCT